MGVSYNGLMPGMSKFYDFKNKDKSVGAYVSYMLSRTQSMFKYSGLPESIPQRIVELYMQTNGNICFAKHNEQLYVFTGGLGGEPDEYYMPTIYTVANPYLKFSKNLKIGVDCIVIPSDSLYIGLLPMYSRYASLMVENDISMRLVDINARIISLISAPDDRTEQAAMSYLKDIEDGKLGVIAETAFLDGVKAQPYATTGAGGRMTDLIEYQQYLKAGWFNDLGLQSNYNMKRESINSNEAQLNEDALLPLIDDMLNCRKIGLEKVNAMFGTNIKVELASSWSERQDPEKEENSGQPEKEESEEKENDRFNEFE
jgi:hypothetical protein